MKVLGVPRWCSDKEPACQCWRHKRCRIDPWVRKIPWRRKWQPAPVFLPGESHRQRNLAGYSPWGSKELDMTEHTCNESSALVLSSESTPPRPLCHTHTCQPFAFAGGRRQIKLQTGSWTRGWGGGTLLILGWTAPAFPLTPHSPSSSFTFKNSIQRTWPQHMSPETARPATGPFIEKLEHQNYSGGAAILTSCKWWQWRW